MLTISSDRSIPVTIAPYFRARWNAAPPIPLPTSSTRTPGESVSGIFEIRYSVVSWPPVLMYPSPKIFSYRKIPVRLYWPWLSYFAVAGLSEVFAELAVVMGALQV